MRLIFMFSVLISIFVLSTCSEINQDKPETIQMPINPNGDSELALLMRAMYDDVERMKIQIKNGETPTTSVNFEKMFTVEATEPEKQASDRFKSFGKLHISTLEALKNADPAEALDLYETLVESCMNCHRALCPGPTVKIKKLYSQK